MPIYRLFIVVLKLIMQILRVSEKEALRKLPVPHGHEVKKTGKITQRLASQFILFA
jgi:hypothetical protein